MFLIPEQQVPTERVWNRISTTFAAPSPRVVEMRYRVNAATIQAAQIFGCLCICIRLDRTCWNLDWPQIFQTF